MYHFLRLCSIVCSRGELGGVNPPVSALDSFSLTSSFLVADGRASDG